MPTTLRETGTRLGEAISGRPSRRQATLISEGWGSSGYYSRALLERDGPMIFPIGTQMFLDHPGRTEETDRPERSVKDLAARVASTPRIVGDALVAEVEVYEHWRPVIDSIAEDIGLSIRAAGETELGEAEGRSGTIVTSLTEGISVDFVTKAGRGGKVGDLIESAQASARKDPEIQKVIAEAKFAEARNAGHWFEARIHAGFTETADRMFGDGYLTREERIGLSSAIGEALTAFNESIASNLPHLYERDPYADPDRASANVIEAAERRQPKEDTTVSDDTRLKALEESVSQLTTQATDTATKLAEAEKREQEAVTRAERAEERIALGIATDVVREAVGKVEGLHERAKERAVKVALVDKLPLLEAGGLDREKLAERATKAAEDERDYLTEAGGRGSVSGFGGGSRPAGGTDGSKELAEAFGRLGLNEKAAQVAANGR